MFKKILKTITIVMSLVMVFGFTCMAAEEWPNIAPTLDDTYDTYLVLKTENDESPWYRCLMFSSSDRTPLAIINESGYHTLKITTGSESPTAVYVTIAGNKKPSNNGWGNLGSTSEKEPEYGYYEIVSGNINVCDASGKVVFRGTPPLQKVVKIQMANFQTEMGGVMKILALCGVGLMVSLLSLTVLFKVLKRFQVI